MDALLALAAADGVAPLAGKDRYEISFRDDGPAGDDGQQSIHRRRDRATSMRAEDGAGGAPNARGRGPVRPRCALEVVWADRCHCTFVRDDLTSRNLSGNVGGLPFVEQGACHISQGGTITSERSRRFHH